MKTHHAVITRALQILLLLPFSACGGGGGYAGSTAQPLSTAPAVPAPPTLEQYSATLSGANETPPNGSAANGTGKLSFDPATKMMSASITTSGIAGTMAHIHEGAPGVAGAVVFPMSEQYAGNGVWSGQATLNDDQIAVLRAGNYYFNVHSANYPAGEIRGQIGVMAP
ncbi:MAG: CHRD domain-containing protein [Pseudomonadota bacterium]